MTELNDDTVIGTHQHCDIFLYLSDLDEPYQEAVERYDELCSDYIKADDRITELEARLAKAEAALEAADELVAPKSLNAPALVVFRNAYRQAREAMK